MGTRLELQSKLENIMESRHVYFQPPESVKMEYPAIRYSLEGVRIERADNSPYYIIDMYELILISRTPAMDMVRKILQLPYCSIGKPYKADNLYHYPFTLYF